MIISVYVALPNNIVVIKVSVMETFGALIYWSNSPLLASTSKTHFVGAYV